MAGTALLLGASGIVGSATADLLLGEGWIVHGLVARATAPAYCRSPPCSSVWLRQDSEAENIRVKPFMICNLLDGLRPGGSTRHVAPVTGLKHYLEPFEAYGQGTVPQTPFREEQGRLDVGHRHEQEPPARLHRLPADR